MMSKLCRHAHLLDEQMTGQPLFWGQNHSDRQYHDLQYMAGRS